MGLNASADFHREVNETVSETISSQLSTISQTNNSESVINQNINIEIAGTLNCASVEVSNEAKVNITGMSEVTTEQFADLTSAALADYETAFNRAVEQLNEDLPIGNVNSDVSVTDIINSSRSLIDVAVETSITNDITQVSNIDQQITFTISGSGIVNVTGACTFDNVSTVDMVAMNAAEAIQSVVTANESYQELEAEYTKALSQTNSGIDITILLIVIGVVIGLAIIIGLLVKFVPKKKNN